jgi:hypothetical protein
MNTPKNKWVEIEEGLKAFKLFETDEMPQLTHGLCNYCYKATMSELDVLRNSN